MVRNYEAMLILMPDISDEEKRAVQEKIKGKIEDLGGKVSNSQIWAKERKFYYPIKSRGAQKKKYEAGCYWLLNFEFDTEKLPDLKEIIRLEEQVLRYILVRRTKVR